MATIAGILTLISGLPQMEQNQLKTILLNESPKISGMEQLIADERFTGGLVCPLCGCIGHVSRNGHRPRWKAKIYLQGLWQNLCC